MTCILLVVLLSLLSPLCFLFASDLEKLADVAGSRSLNNSLDNGLFRAGWLQSSFRVWLVFVYFVYVLFSAFSSTCVLLAKSRELLKLQRKLLSLAR